MTRLAILLFVLTLVLGLLGALGPSRVFRGPGWRSRREPQPGARATQRALLLISAVCFLFGGCGALQAADRNSWSSGELGDAVRKVADDMESEPGLVGVSGDGELSIQEKVIAAGDGAGPATQIEVRASGSDYTVSAGKSPAYCLRVESSKSDGGLRVPGADGDTTFVNERDYRTRVEKGRC